VRTGGSTARRIIMPSKKDTDASPEPPKNHRIEHEAEGAASGALAGGVMGAGAGPVGIAAGAIIGGIAGAIAGAVLDEDSSEQAERTRELDATIGVTEGDLGAPNLKHPKEGRVLVGYPKATTGAEKAPDEERDEHPIVPSNPVPSKP
jgi:hypothetical protein